MPADAVRLFAKLMLAAAEAAREARPSEWEAPSGAVVYRPEVTEGVRPPYSGPKPYTAIIRDEKTGGQLSKPLLQGARHDFADLAGSKTVWKLERTGKPAIYFVTRIVSSTNKYQRRYKPPIEIIHASEDGFFPFEEALYTDDFSFERVAAMLDLQGSKDGNPKGRVYFDSRDGYRERNRVMARKRAERRIRVANFDRYPLRHHDWAVYYPDLAGYSYDADKGLSTAPDGSTLRWTEGKWTIGLNYSGECYGVGAVWTAPDGRRKQALTMIPHRAWRDGHGETRCAQLIYSHRPEGVDDVSTPPVPDGETLSGLVNANGNIAGEHRGQMIIIDSRPHGHDWRVTTSESWW